MSRLELRGINIRVGEFKVADINLDIEGYFVLMGHTGSGKSLLAKAICGLLQVESGSVLLDERNLTGLEPRRRRIGYVPQDSGLFPHLNVHQNICFSRNSDADEIIESLKLEPLLKRMPAGLSGGERQKVALARALVSRPQVLILDEPVSALDRSSRRATCELLKLIHAEFELTTVHISHSWSETLLMAQQVGVMAGGQLLQSGTPVELTASPVNSEVADIVAS